MMMQEVSLAMEGNKFKNEQGQKKKKKKRPI